MFKVYDQAGQNALCVTTLADVAELTGATAEQIRRMSLYRWTVRSINGFEIINYKF